MSSIRELIIDKVALAAERVSVARSEEAALIEYETANKGSAADGYWQERYAAEMRLNAAMALWDALLDVERMPPIVVPGTTKPERSRKMYREVNYAPD